MGTTILDALLVRWRQNATMLRECGATPQAELVAKLAAEVQAALTEWELEALTLEAAETESGYSYSALQQKVASGELENVGRKHRPRIRRRDLPRKGVSRTRSIAEETLLSRLA